MAEPTIKIKRSSVAGKTPTTSNLALGELGLNTYDGKLFLKQDQGGVGVGTTVITVNPWSVGVGSVAYNTYFTAGNVGIGTTNPTESLSVLNKIQILNDASSNGRLILRGQPGSSYRWNIDNYSSSNLFRIFREDDATSANGSVAVSISTTGTLTATKFSGDGSLITGITVTPAGSDGQVQYNNGGVTGGASALYYDDTNNRVGINTTVPTSLLTVIGSASISGILTVDQLYTSNNGNGTNIRIGDDLWLGDINVANTTRLSGAQNSDRAFIVFGNSDAVALGRTGTGPLYYGGNFNVAGIITASSFSGNATSATYATTAGVSTYATTAGVSTYATTAGVSTYATTAGVSTYATTAGVATALQNSRTFEITGDIIASPISFNGTGNVSLAATIQPNSVALGTDTTGDYVQTITGTSNQITVTNGTGEGSTPTLSIPNQFTAPQDVTVTRDLQVNRNLNVNGNITIGGTSATLFTTEFKVYDPDIVLGFRTDANNNDTSTDTTANHGGIAIASTEGTPLVQLFIAGIETTPATYKKIMWFKSGSFTGLGTDAWLSNYAVGIGSTQFPTGTRLAAGNVQFTQNDLAVVRNINASGIITATTFIGNLIGYASTAGIATYATTAGVSTYSTTAGIATYATTAGVSTYATTAGVSTYATTAGVSTYATTAGVSTYATTAGIATYATTAGVSTYATTAGVSTSVIGGISSVTQLNVSGVTTTTTLELQSQIVSGYATSTTTATTANQVIYSGLSTVTYRSAEFLIQATEGTNYQVEKLITIHNGTTTYDSEYANVTSGNLVANYATDISGGNIRLLVTPASANSTTYKIQYTGIKV